MHPISLHSSCLAKRDLASRYAKDCQGPLIKLVKDSRLWSQLQILLGRHQVSAFSLFTRGSVPNSSAFACFVRWKWWLFVVLRRWQCLSAERLLFRDVSSVKLSIFLAPCHVNTGCIRLPCGLLFRFDGFGAFWCTWEEQQRFVVCNQDPCVLDVLVARQSLPWIWTMWRTTPYHRHWSPETLEECVECFYKQWLVKATAVNVCCLFCQVFFFFPSFQYCPIVQFWILVVTCCNLSAPQAGIAADSTKLVTSGFANRMADRVMQELLWDPQLFGFH